MNEEVECMKSLTQLINVMKNILAIYKGIATTEAKGTKMIIEMINRYEETLIKKNALPFKTHAPLFVEAYEKNRQAFLDINDDSSFLSTRNICIWFGKNNEKAKAKNMKLPINICYEKAREMHNPLEDKLIDGDDDAADTHNSKIMEKTEYTMYYEIQYALLDVIAHSLFVMDKFTCDIKTLRRNIKDLQDFIFLNEDGEVQGSTMQSVVKGLISGVARTTGKTVDLDLSKFDEHAKNAETMLSDGKIVGIATDMINDFTNVKPAPGQSITELMIENIRIHGPKLEEAFGSSTEPAPEGVTVEGHSGTTTTQTKIKEDEIEFV